MGQNACSRVLCTRLALVLLTLCGLCPFVPFWLPSNDFRLTERMTSGICPQSPCHHEAQPHSSVRAVQDPLTSSHAHVSSMRTLEYCHTYGRFTNQLMVFLRALWLAARLKRQLVMPGYIMNVPLSEILDMHFIDAYLNSSGGYVLAETVGCRKVQHVWAAPEEVNRRARSLGPSTCTKAFRCSFGGAEEVKPLVLDKRWNQSSWDALDQTMPERMAFTAVGLHKLHVGERVVVPYRPGLVEVARRILAELPEIPSSEAHEAHTEVIPISMCAHVRRDDLVGKVPSLNSTVSFLLRTMEAVKPSFTVSKLVIIHDAHPDEVDYMRSNLPKGTLFGCDGEKWRECRSAVGRIVVEQALCSMADVFIGSPVSTFTNHIVAQREFVFGKSRQSWRKIGEDKKQLILSM